MRVHPPKMKIFRLSNPLLLLLLLPVVFVAFAVFATFFLFTLLLSGLPRRRASLQKQRAPDLSIASGSVIEAEFHHVKN